VRQPVRLFAIVGLVCGFCAQWQCAALRAG
jgi:hypothetical protein